MDSYKLSDTFWIPTFLGRSEYLYPHVLISKITFSIPSCMFTRLRSYLPTIVSILFFYKFVYWYSNEKLLDIEKNEYHKKYIPNKKTETHHYIGSSIIHLSDPIGRPGMSITDYYKHSPPLN